VSRSATQTRGARREAQTKVAYRLERIHELTQHDPRQPAGQERLSVGLKARAVRDRRGGLKPQTGDRRATAKSSTTSNRLTAPHRLDLRRDRRLQLVVSRPEASPRHLPLSAPLPSLDGSPGSSVMSR
jgi:hypothetical protein